MFLLILREKGEEREILIISLPYNWGSNLQPFGVKDDAPTEPSSQGLRHALVDCWSTRGQIKSHGEKNIWRNKYWEFSKINRHHTIDPKHSTPSRINLYTQGISC